MAVQQQISDHSAHQIQCYALFVRHPSETTEQGTVLARKLPEQTDRMGLTADRATASHVGLQHRS
ncbi:MAG: hypothetical protein NTNFB02_25680 [Nitrospira sp.]